MEVQMAFFEAKAAAVASALTLLFLETSFHSALSQENSVTAPARPATQDGILRFLLVAHFDIAYADGDQGIEGAAPRPVRTASQSKNKLARGGPLHLFRSSEGKIEHKAAQPAQRKKSY
jgi:hypothetical protein